MLLGFNTNSREHSWMYAFNQYLVAEGYIVLSVNYRGGTGYGPLTTERPTTSGPAAASSVTFSAPSPICEAERTWTPKDWASWGDSYGGLMTALGLARTSDALAAGCRLCRNI